MIHQKKRLVNPKIESLMAQELKKLINLRIIYPINHSMWVSNLVPIKKKNGNIQFHVDLKELNRASLKDHFPLPSMEQIL